MPCTRVVLPGGVVALVHHSKQAGLKPCCVCSRLSSKLCDFPLTGTKAGKTCDRPICDKCTTHVEPDTDYCPPHARMVAAALGGAE